MTHDHRFTPVPVRARRDGWTPARQIAFIAALRETKHVAAACRAVGMSWQTAYRLRTRPDAGGFAAAWDAAVARDPVRVVSGRAMDGRPTPIIYRGRRVGERRRHDNRLAMWLVQRHDRARHAADQRPPRVDTAANLHAALVALADEALARPVSPGDVARTSSPSTLPIATPHPHPPSSPRKPNLPSSPRTREPISGRSRPGRTAGAGPPPSRG